MRSPTFFEQFADLYQRIKGGRLLVCAGQSAMRLVAVAGHLEPQSELPCFLVAHAPLTENDTARQELQAIHYQAGTPHVHWLHYGGPPRVLLSRPDMPLRVLLPARPNSTMLPMIDGAAVNHPEEKIGTEQPMQHAPESLSVMSRLLLAGQVAPTQEHSARQTIPLQ